ncbi:MAG: alginate export family protein [Cloacibacterium sp.]|nr:alginate export family protein [Cloacibacterium sp.]
MKTIGIRQIAMLIVMVLGGTTFAQEVNANLQLRPRYEYRNGFKGLMPDTELPTSFVSQRSRLNLNFKQEKISAKLTLQNVRTWGDVKTTTTNDKNGIILFEAWGQYQFDENWSTRVGRQVISYDNQRIFGEIDWLQQGQSHDAAVVSYKKGKHQLDFGAALNADSEDLFRNLYTTNYKNMQYAWYHTDFSNFQMSLLALNTGFQYEQPATTNLEIDYIQTFGTFLKYKKNKLDADLSLYAQTGKGKLTSNNTTVNAYNVGVNINYAVTNEVKAGLGYEYLSGKDQTDTENIIKSFNPIFGTNHAFNGFMDYFYVGNHKNTVGLQDVYLKLNYAPNKWNFAVTPHVFMTAADVKNPFTAYAMDDYLGTEVDITVGYALHKNIGISAGYSQMFGTETLEVLKGGNKDLDNNWAYVMVNFNPKIFSFSK